MERYDHRGIELKWQKLWDSEHAFAAPEVPKGEHAYVLDMFPYPSAQGLHVGHPEGYTATDIYCRYLRMKGVSVLHPMGWDAFGLPAENFAIKTGRHPQEVTWENIDNFRRQIKSLGFSYDWSREVNTANPTYYKWTQWLFLKLYEKGLAYRKEAPVNWCPSCQTVLANEQVVDGVCERCGTKVEQRNMKQWFFKTTAYAGQLLAELENLDWPKPIVDMQKNWIGKSEGAEVIFKIPNSKFQIPVFTTRLDTIFGATFVVISPELAKQWIDVGWQTTPEAKNYVEKALMGRELERMERAAKEKTGVDTGVKAIHPATKEEIPVWVADYVLGSYGTGAIMAVPAHDERDFEFAKKFSLPIKKVIVPVRKPFALILHGITGHNQENWFPWLKEQLEQIGWEVAVPNLPSADHPTVTGWQDALRPYLAKLDESSVIIGHSLGARAALDFVQLLSKPIGKLILVAPTSQQQKWEELDKSTPSVDWKTVREFNEPALRTEKIIANAKEIIVYYSDNDPYIPLESIEFYRELFSNARYEFLPGRYHFSENHGDMREFPELYSHLAGVVLVDDGILVQSGKFTGLSSVEARHKIASQIGAVLKTQYRLRDWLISRQRYWGAPIPIIYCEACGEVPVPEKNLPVELPSDVDFRPTGESPLARSKTFHDVVCPKCGKPARRESDTMDTFVDSSWYFLRYCDPQNTEAVFDPKKVAAWSPVSLYVGGAEHAVLHLMYARFITKVLQDMGYVKFSEPFLKLRNQGLILGEDGQKMSKSKGNVINPDEIVEKYGADTLRLYEMFMGPLEDAKPWNTSSIVGIRRFLERVWNLCLDQNEQTNLIRLHESEEASAIKKNTEDIEAFHFNTAISSLMIYSNALAEASLVQRTAGVRVLLVLLYPFAPHITSELWEQLKFGGNIWEQDWPTYDKEALRQQTVTIAVQVNGKLRGTVDVSPEAAEAEVVSAARAVPGVAKYLTSEPKKVVFVPGKLVSFVV